MIESLQDTPSLILLVFLGIVALLVLVIWSIRRHRSPRLKVDCKASIKDLVPTLAGLTLSTPTHGNSVEVLINGAFWDVLVASIQAARQSVNFETFLWKEGKLGQRMADTLAERARAGIKVRVMLDAQGSQKAGKEAVRQMREAGCRVEFFHKRSIYTVGVLNDRDHRKLVVVDGREAFVGGHCVVDEWLGDAEDGKHFADVSVRLHGPIVHSIQAAFSENWAGETGELFAGDNEFPALEPAGDITVHAAYAKPENSAPAVKILHHTVICLAREKLWIQNPYFIPKVEAVKALGEAVKRGVDVRVLMPSTSGSDNPMVQHAGHRNFEQLLKSGVRLFEYPHTLLHQKAMTVDDVWCAVGSTNFDDRSFDTNDEITLGICDRGITRQINDVFERYVARATEITLEQWQTRNWFERSRASVYYLIHNLL
ncbi:phosphatidylserine/phosphatidylglycerophosphate/cardiolipin synthase family protein [Caenimonas terrae]|uniref:Phosphatidylserine/phosphatidylglycerophosphate/ cardiolipin synthase family protein n=1 Tax=Caenimonas terrae TaxID=696074 RepID=A0ABW0NF73_9BURK